MRPLLVCLLTATLLAPAVAADWASFHKDALGTGSVAGSAYAVYEEMWWNNKTLLNQQVYASPVIKDQVVVVADRAGLVRGLDGESGAELWSHAMSASVEGTPAIAGERVYVVDVQGNLKALNLGDGRVETTASVSVGQTHGSVREHQGKVFVGNDAGQMKAYYASTLQLLWTFDLSQVFTLFAPPASSPTSPSVCQNPMSPQPIYGAPAVFGGRVFFGSFNHYVLAVDEDGLGNGRTTLHWIFLTGDLVAASPAIRVINANSYHVLIGSYDGKLYNFDGPATHAGGPCDVGGSAVWTTPIVSPLWTYTVPTGIERKFESSPAVAGDKVFFGGNNGHTYAVKASDGTLAWEQPDTGSELAYVTSSPAVANDIVVIGSKDKNVYWLDADDGQILKTFPGQGAFGTSPAIDGDRVYIASTDGILYMLGPKVPPRPDLVIGSIVIGADSVTVAIKNIGGKDAEASKVRLLLDGTLLADKDVSAIPAGADVTVSHAITISPGVHKVRALADFGAPGAVKESNESNNADEASTEIAQPPPAPEEGSSTGSKGKIPGPGLPLAALGLVAAGILMRRRR